MGGMNLYTYTKNPVTWFDPKGLMASGWGFPVHQQIDNAALGREMSSRDLNILNAGQMLADSDDFQGVTLDMTVRHAMNAMNPDTNLPYSKAVACKKANDFVRGQFKKAWDAEAAGDHRAALTEFALGLHALQDGVSPAHTNFQVWDGNMTAAHAWADILPSSALKSKLIDVTKEAWGWFKTGKLPDKDNLFRCECEDPQPSPFPPMYPPSLPAMSIGDMFLEMSH